MKIRKEEEKDRDEIYALVQTAFSGAAHADGNEQDLVNALRAGSAYIPELSLAAEENGRIIGHIMFTKAHVGSEAVLALAPLSVLPDCQRKGIGGALIETGHTVARQLGYAYCIVLGSEKYYPRFGYVPADTFGITAPFDVPRENFMACKIADDADDICGIMKYADEFGIE